MAFNLLAFAGGAASAIEEKMDTAEKEAKTFAMASTKNMHDKYMKRIEEDKVLVSEAASDMELIKAHTASMMGGKTLTSEQLEQLSRSPTNRKYFVNAIQGGKVNFGNLDPDQLVKLVANNPAPNVARDRIGQALTLDSTLKDTITKQTTAKQMGFFDRIGESAGKAAAQKTAMALGTTVEEMQAKLAETRPTATATFDFSGVKDRKTSQELADEAKVRAFEARKSGNTEAEKDALIDYGVITAFGAKPKTEKEKLEENKARLTNIAAKGGKEGAAAQKELDVYAEIEAKEARIKHIKSDKKEDTTSLGSLNSFVRDAAARGVILNHGNAKDLVRTVLPDGTVSAEYNGDPTSEPAKQIDITRKKAALAALRFYEEKFPNDINVKAIRQSWEKITTTEPPPEPVAPPKPALPVLQPKTAASPTAAPAVPAKFEEGKIYEDAKGNKAKYVNGKWEPQ